MKKVSAFLCLFVLLTAFTCENEPLDTGIDLTTPNESLVGDWNLVDYDVTLNTVTSFQGQEIESDIEITSTDVDYVLSLNQSTFTTNGSYSYDTNIVVNGTPFSTDSYTLSSVNGMGTYSTNGNQMTVDGSFFQFDFNGTVDTSALDGEQTVTFEVSDNGQILTFTQNETTTETDPTTGTVVTTSTVSTSVWTTESGGGNNSTPCEDAQAATSTAEQAYTNDTSDENLCNAYKTALQNQITVCGDTDGSLQNTIDGLGDCTSGGNTTTGTLTVRAGTLVIDFVNKTVTENNGLITVEGASSQGNYLIYFQVTEGATGTDIFQNFKLTLGNTEYFPSTQGFDDFTSTTTVSSGNILQATFWGIVESNAGADLSLTQGEADVTY